MKKLVYITVAILALTACATHRALNLTNLTTGMSKGQVERVAGSPYRVLAVNDTRDGYQEVLEYRTAYGDIYALEFWNDYLVGYEYIDQEMTYVPVYTPPPYYPDYGRPIIVVRPDRRPSTGRHPPTRPPSTSKPSTSKPSTSKPSTSKPSSDKPYQGGRSSGSSSVNSSSGRSSESKSTSNGRRSSSSSSGRTR